MIILGNPCKHWDHVLDVVVERGESRICGFCNIEEGAYLFRQRLLTDSRYQPDSCFMYA